jgi:hypothetical protein
MIDGSQVPATPKVTHSGSTVSLSTAFGTLEVDPSSGGKLTLLNNQKQVLLSSPTAGLSSYDSKNDELSVFLGTATDSSTPRKYYGAGFEPGSPLSVDHSTPSVGNDYGKGAWSWAPQYYSPTDKYAALGVGKYDLPVQSGGGVCLPDNTGRQDCGFYNITEKQCTDKNCCWGPTKEQLPWCYAKTSAPMNDYPVSWKSKDTGVSWTIRGAAVDIYLMPSSDFYEFRRCHSHLTGKARMIPRYAFGFLAGRWGWKDRADIESKLEQFRNGSFPIDAFISDFEWFTKANDYGLPPKGAADYTDFGYNPVTFPDPKVQLDKYHGMGFKFGGIRKPRLGNTELLNYARQNGWLVPGGESGIDRNLNYSIDAMRTWYAEQNNHYLDDGVDFWWNDEGEVTYFMFDGWNEAEYLGYTNKSTTRKDKRFFSINRVYTPGMQRFGLSIWTGDIAVSWESMTRSRMRY